MSGFTPTELLRMGRSLGIGFRKWEEMGAGAIRSLQKFHSDPDFSSERLEKRLQKAAAEILDKHLPWSQQWSRQMRQLQMTSIVGGPEALERTFQPQITFAFKALEVAQEDPEIRKKIFGSDGDYLGQIWMTQLYFLSSSSKSDDQMAYDWLTPTCRMMDKTLTSMDPELKSPVTKVLKFKCAAREVSVKWNRTEPKKCEKSELKQLAKDKNFFSITDGYLEIVPVSYDAITNAICLASVLEEEHRYDELYKKLKTVNPRRLELILNPKNANDKYQYDSDFDHFRKWMEPIPDNG